MKLITSKNEIPAQGKVAFIDFLNFRNVYQQISFIASTQIEEVYVKIMVL